MRVRHAPSSVTVADDCTSFYSLYPHRNVFIYHFSLNEYTLYIHINIRLYIHIIKYYSTEVYGENKL